MRHICVSKLTIIGSDNGLSPERRQAIIWTNAGILLIWNLRTNFSEILSQINTFSFKKTLLKMSSGKWRPFCLGLSVLTWSNITWYFTQHFSYWGITWIRCVRCVRWEVSIVSFFFFCLTKNWDVWDERCLLWVFFFLTKNWPCYNGTAL